MKRNILIAFLGVLMASGCATVSVDSDWDTSFDFSSLQNYNWASTSQKVTGDLRLDSQLTDERIRTAIDQGFQARGFQSVSKNPDFLVAYHANIEEKLDVTTIPHYDYSYPSNFDLFSGNINTMGSSMQTEQFVYQYEEGSILVDVIAPATKQLIWRGSVKGVVKEKVTPTQRKERIQKAVNKMLMQFPPE